MKLRFIATLALGFALSAFAADQTSVAGKWQVHTTIAGNEYDVTCNFTQKDSDLTGTCEGDQGAKDVTGKIDGDTVKWSYKSEYNGTPLTVNHTGTLKDGKITGTVDVPEFSATGDFTATSANAKEK